MIAHKFYSIVPIARIEQSSIWAITIAPVASSPLNFPLLFPYNRQDRPYTISSDRSDPGDASDRMETRLKLAEHSFRAVSSVV